MNARCVCGRKPRSNVGPCSRCYHREWRANNRAERTAIARTYYQRNRERILAYRAAWRAKQRAARNRVPYTHKEVYEQAVVPVSVPGWGFACRE